VHERLRAGAKPLVVLTHSPVLREPRKRSLTTLFSFPNSFVRKFLES
jgi:hypothetical protein